jgi:hypothetical protein
MIVMITGRLANTRQALVAFGSGFDWLLLAIPHLAAWPMPPVYFSLVGKTVDRPDRLLIRALGPPGSAPIGFGLPVHGVGGSSPS